MMKEDKNINGPMWKSDCLKGVLAATFILAISSGFWKAPSESVESKTQPVSGKTRTGAMSKSEKDAAVRSYIDVFDLD